MKNNVLHKAILKGASFKEAVSKQLLSTDALQQKNDDGLTPLALSIQVGNKYFFNLLLSRGKDAIDYEGLTALHIACAVGEVGMYKGLKEYYSDININDNGGWTPLHWAVQEGHTSIVKDLLSSGADPNLGDAHGITPLCLSVTEGRQKIFEYLLGVGGNVKQKIEDETLLHIATAWDNRWFVKRLLECGLSPYEKDDSGLTPYDIAINQNHKAIKNMFSSIAKDVRSD